MGLASHLDALELSQVMRWSRLARTLALALILLLMLAVFADFHRSGKIYARGSLLPYYLLFLAAAYAVCIFVECLSLWWGHERHFYCARTLVHVMAVVAVAVQMGLFFAAGGAARAGVASLGGSTRPDQAGFAAGAVVAVQLASPRWDGVSPVSVQE